MDLDLVRQLAVPNDTKIVLAVVDGLGGLAHPQTGRTELEAADTPHLDRLAGGGMNFHAAYTTTPLCTPARAALASIARKAAFFLSLADSTRPQSFAARNGGGSDSRFCLPAKA